MKIAVVTACTSTLPNYRLDMVKEFKFRGHEVIVFGDEPEGQWATYFAKLGIGYREYFVSRNGLNPLHDMRTKNELKQLFFDEKIDCVWTYQVKPNIYGCLAAAEAGIKNVYAMMGGTGSVFHSSDLKSRFAKAIVTAEYRMAYRQVTKVFFQNTEDRDLFESLGIVSRDKVVLTRGSGVNLSHFRYAPLPQSDSFLFVGRLVRGKGVFEYLEAARIVKKAHPQAQFHLVGPFDANPTSLQPEQLDSYIEDGTVEFHGEQRDVRPFLEKCSCFVLPSYYGEGTPKSCLEAMATGRPLIVADAVGSREVLAHGDNGILVKPKSVDSLAHAMMRMIEDRQTSERMSKESRRIAETVFDVRAVNSVICNTMGIG